MKISLNLDLEKKEKVAWCKENGGMEHLTNRERRHGAFGMHRKVMWSTSMHRKVAWSTWHMEKGSMEHLVCIESWHGAPGMHRKVMWSSWHA